MLPTHRLSPKNQVTIPREARALQGTGEVGHLRGRMHGIPGQQSAEIFRVVMLMTESELQRREARILADTALSGDEKFKLVTELNGGMAMMSLDDQRRIVLPQHFVAYLGLDRDVFFVCTNTTIQAWHPDQYLRWSGADTRAPAAPVYNPALNTYLAI